MTEKRLFVGRKTVEDRFTIILDYDDEIGVKENHSGDVIVLNHRDLNSEQFVAQLVVFLNDQNQAIVDLYDGNKYWSDKATEKIKELQNENEQLKEEIKDLNDVLASYEEIESKKFNQSNCITVQKSTICDLKKEIEELKQETKRLKRLTTPYYEIDIEKAIPIIAECRGITVEEYLEKIEEEYTKEGDLE